MSVSTSQVRPIAEAPQETFTDLTSHSRAFGGQVYEEVAERYLQFRREYYMEEHPALDTLPPQHAEIHRSELALLAEQTLRLVPAAVRSVPVVGGLLDHLGHVADIHSISEAERTALHNMTMTFLHGTRDGIQPWYAQWLLVSAQQLSIITDTEYFMEFPWDACVYMPPDDLAAYERAMRTNDITGIEAGIRRVANNLCLALKEPIDTQVAFVFTGPDADHRRERFQLKTAAALALGAILIGEEARLLLRPHPPAQPPRSVLAPLPDDLSSEATSTLNSAH